MSATSSVQGTEFARVSGSYSTAWVGSYELLSQDPIANTSTIRLYGSMYYGGGTSAGSDNSSDTMQVNGVTISPPTPSEYRYSQSHTYGYRVYPGYSLFGYTDKVVTHNANGTFPTQNISIYAKSFHISSKNASGAISGIASIDRTSALATATVDNIEATGFRLNVTSDKPVNKWEYNINGGTWTTFSTTDGTSASVNITGLSPATSYTINVRVTRTYNGVQSTATVTAETLGQSMIASITDVNVGSATTLTFVPNTTTYYFRVVFLLGDTVLATENIGNRASLTTQSYTSTYKFPASTLPNATSGQFTARLETYSDSGYAHLIGSDTETFTVTVPDTTAYQPNGTVTLTPYNSNAWLASKNIYVGGYSAIDVSVNPTAGAGANVASVEINGVTATSTGTNQFRTEVLTGSGAKTFNVIVTDSRGRSKTLAQSVNYLSYSAPSIYVSYERGTYANGAWTANVSGAHIRVSVSTYCSLTDYGNTVTLTPTATIGGTPTPPSVTDGTVYYWTNTSTDNSYDFTVTAVDSVGVTSVTTFTVSSVQVPFNLNTSMPAAAFGKVAEHTKVLEIADGWQLSIGGVLIPDDTQGGKVLAMKADGSGLEWKSI